MAIRMFWELIKGAPRSGTVTTALKNSFLKTSTDLKNKVHTISTDELFSNFTDHEMQDCAMFFCYFIDRLCVEEIEARKLALYAKFAGFPTIDSVFSEQLSTAVNIVAGCYHIDVKYDKFIVLSLPMPPCSLQLLSNTSICILH